MANNKRKRKASFGVLFWIAVILLFLVVFVATKPRIQSVIQNTGLLTVLKDRFGNSASDANSNVETRNIIIGTGKGAPNEHTNGTSSPGTTSQPQPQTTPKFRSVPGLGGTPSGTETGTSKNSNSAGSSAGSAAGSALPQNNSSSNGPAPSSTSLTSLPAPSSSAGGKSAGGASAAGKSSTPNPSGSSPKGPQYHVRAFKLFYTLVTDDGKILPKAVTRDVKYIDSPLTQTIRLLLKGPTADELNKGLLNLIPQHTQLLSAYVQNGIAYLNFNEAFEFNPMGVEGFIAQLKQIVHTATEFPTVSRVQFLVKGKKVNYLGGEGIYIGKPLGRNSFS